MKIKKSALWVSCVFLFLLFAPYLPADSGPPMPKSESRLKKRSPKEVAIAYYNKGISLRDTAWEHEKKAEEAGEDIQGKFNQKAKKSYSKAIKQYRMAIKKDPQLFQAHSSLGYALRKTGDFQASLESYNKALEINPTYTEAVEYRAEAHLGLNMLEESRDAYLVLFKHDRPRADKLLVAMKDWAEAHREDPGHVGREKVDKFTKWVNERDEIAKKTGSKGSNGVW